MMPGDADPQNPAIRWHGQIPVPVRGDRRLRRSIAAYGDAAARARAPRRQAVRRDEPDLRVTP